jgi:apolipoprotein N-acyltransferase
MPVFLAIVPLTTVVFGFGFVAAVFATVMALAAWIGARVGPWGRVLAYPLALTAIDVLAFRGAPDLASRSLAYTQVGFLPVVQTAAVLGPAGITFLLALLPSALAEWLARRQTRGNRILAWVVAVEATAIGLGYARMVAMPTEPTVRVGLAASDPDLRFFRSDQRDEVIPVVESYARRVRALAVQGATVVVLPEKMVSIAPSYSEEAARILAAAARDSRARVVAGINLVGIPAPRNVAWVFAPDGQLELEYAKRLLVPRYEDGYASGTEPGFVNGESGTIGIAVCRDLFLARPFLAYGRARARILLVPGWDFTVDAPLATREPVLRAVEGGYPVVRAAQEGILFVVDAAGRVLLRRPSWEARETTAVIDVPLGGGGTLYAQLGDAFGAMAGISLVSLLVLAWRRRAPSD